ncbi:MAG: hypothetical protein IKT46_09325 [Clostridia bacterium]|nr:hypothetical protein [Clostridia bacterium]
MSFDKKSSYYANCDLDAYLNQEFFYSLSCNLQELIPETDIEITSKESIGSCGYITKTIKRKVFLLSCTEVGLKNNSLLVSEGEKIDFFNTSAHLIAFQNNSPSSWWLRSSYTWYRNAAWAIGSNGKIGSGDVSALNGVRPAFCIKGDIEVYKKDNIYYID